MNEVRTFVFAIEYNRAVEPAGRWQGAVQKRCIHSGAGGCLFVPVACSTTGLRLYLEEDWNMLMVALPHEVKRNALSELQSRHRILSFHVPSMVMERLINCVSKFCRLN